MCKLTLMNSQAFILTSQFHGRDGLGLADKIRSLMCPDPWLAPWNLNVIWCLNDISFENGASRSKFPKALFLDRIDP